MSAETTKLKLLVDFTDEKSLKIFQHSLTLLYSLPKIEELLNGTISTIKSMIFKCSAVCITYLFI